MRKISSYQFISILLCCKLFSIMTYIPDKDDNAAVILITIVITTIIQAILVIPAIAFYNKNNGEGILSFANSKSRILSVTISILFLLLCLWAIIESTGDLAFFLQYCFSDTYASWAVIIVIAAATFYVAHTGISTLARMTGIIVVVTLIGLALTLTGFEHHMNFVELNIAVRDPIRDVIKTTPKFFAASQELVAFVILLDALRCKPAKTIYSYLGFKLIITLLSAMTIIIVLGDFVYLAKFPFFTLSSYLQTKIIEHYGALFMIFWTLCALVKLTIFTICAQHCIHQIFPKLNPLVGEGISLFVASAITLPIILKETWEAIAAPRLESILIAFLLAVIPLILLFLKKRKTE